MPVSFTWEFYKNFLIKLFYNFENTILKIKSPLKFKCSMYIRINQFEMIQKY